MAYKPINGPKMSLEQKHARAKELLCELYNYTQGTMSISQSELYSLKNSFAGLIEEMVKFIKDKQLGPKISIFISPGEATAEEHYKNAENALETLYNMIVGIDYFSVKDVRMYQAKVIAHMNNFISVHMKQHEESYYRTAF